MLNERRGLPKRHRIFRLHGVYNQAATHSGLADVHFAGGGSLGASPPPLGRRRSAIDYAAARKRCHEGIVFLRLSRRQMFCAGLCEAKPSPGAAQGRTEWDPEATAQDQRGGFVAGRTFVRSDGVNSALRRCSRTGISVLVGTAARWRSSGEPASTRWNCAVAKRSTR